MWGLSLVFPACLCTVVSMSLFSVAVLFFFITENQRHTQRKKTINHLQPTNNTENIKILKAPCIPLLIYIPSLFHDKIYTLELHVFLLAVLIHGYIFQNSIDVCINYHCFHIFQMQVLELSHNQIYTLCLIFPDFSISEILCIMRLKHSRDDHYSTYYQQY